MTLAAYYYPATRTHRAALDLVEINPADGSTRTVQTFHADRMTKPQARFTAKANGATPWNF